MANRSMRESVELELAEWRTTFPYYSPQSVITELLEPRDRKIASLSALLAVAKAPEHATHEVHWNTAGRVLNCPGCKWEEAIREQHPEIWRKRQA